MKQSFNFKNINLIICSYQKKTKMLKQLSFFYCILWTLLNNIFIIHAFEEDLIDEKCSKLNWFNQQLDHNSFINNQTFKQRYILNTDNWKPNNPIFFFVGFQVDITTLCNQFGFVWESAAEFGAMVLFAEHRYYGESLPYGNNTFNDLKNLVYLTSEQAIMDYVYLLKYLKKTIRGAANSKVIAFGSSYGGMLATWIRAKYPHLIDGALAGSAPLLLTETDCNAHYNQVTKSFSRYGDSCTEAIRKSWSIYTKKFETENGLQNLAQEFKLCSTKFKLNEFKETIKHAFESIAANDYAYETEVFHALPAWPVRAVCQRISSNLDLNSETSILKQVAYGLEIFFNYTGENDCLELGIPEGINKNAYLAATYLYCTGIFFPFCTNGKTDMFEPMEWNFQEFSDKCYKDYGVRPKQDWLQNIYGVDKINVLTNIIFTHGDVDPWFATGVLNVTNNKLNVIVIKDGAHHAGLLTSNEADNQSVKDARRKIKRIFASWLSDNNYTVNNSACRVKIILLSNISILVIFNLILKVM